MFPDHILVQEDNFPAGTAPKWRGKKFFTFSAQSEEETEGRVMYIAAVTLVLLQLFGTLKEKLTRKKIAAKATYNFQLFLSPNSFFFAIRIRLSRPRLRGGGPGIGPGGAGEAPGGDGGAAGAGRRAGKTISQKKYFERRHSNLEYAVF